MASLRIPEPYKAGLTQIASLDENTAQELLEALKTIPPALYRKDVSARLAERVGSISPGDIRDVIESLFGLTLGRIGSDVSVQQFVDDILDTLADEESAIITDENRDAVRQKLNHLLNVDSLMIGAKAYEVLFEHERNFTTARILTDVRPVFGDKVEGDPVAAIIVHNLKVNYFEAGKRLEFYVAMDTSDVQKLIDTLERARAKAESLKEMLASTEILYVDAE